MTYQTQYDIGVMMSRSGLWFLVTALLYLHFAMCDGQNIDTANCASKETCSACIQTPQCCWCTKAKESHCLLSSDDNSIICEDGTNCYKPESSSWKEKDEELGVSTINGKVKTVQIRPQHVKLQMRVGDTYNLQLQYKQATDYPVDLYYLMDLSQSMADDKDELSALGNSLAEAMKNLTKNFKIGFGSFVDKVAMPFVSTVPRKLKEPCTGCVGPYSFKNHLALTTNTDEFSKKVDATKVSGNLDSPEGGFDALMQAMVCTKEIGWRDKARHLLVFSTDASFHLAGDGKLAGIVLPNDGKCHMKGGEYDKYLDFDYPSISQLNQKATQNNINLIFAVTSNQISLYNSLQSRIKGASHGLLDNRSKNVIKLVLDQYEKLVDSVTLDNNDNNEYFTVNYFSKCLNEAGPLRETKTCEGTRVNVTVNYTAQIKVLKCPNEGQRNQTLVIKPLSVNEDLTVEIEIICDCPCEYPGHRDYIPEDDAQCSGSASLCGVCSCIEGKEGKHCECDENKKDSNSGDDTDACTAKGDDQPCSGRGSCVCGLCKCNDDKKFSGKYCECDNFSCYLVNKVLCAGQGECKCGKCECRPPYTGEECSCEDDRSKCMKPNSNEICSGKGTCKCGRCSCNDTMYSGQFCDDCHTCPGKRCEELSNCVECIAYKENKGEKCAGCEKLVKVELLDSLGEDDSQNGKHKCVRLIAENDCRFVFIYTDAAKTPVTVQAQKTKECRGDVDVLAIVLGITGGTVIIGLLSLIAWKVLTNIHDRREYVKFEKERALSKFDRGDNPLYKPSTSTFNNPTFGN